MLILKSKGTIPNIPEYQFIADSDSDIAKINAVRTNDEGTIVYHVELLGNGEQFAPTTNLIPTYASHNVSKG